MSINEDTSFIEYPVDQPTQDFVTNFDTIGGTTDVVLVTVDGVLTDTPESSYTVQQINHTTWRVTPEVPADSVVRLYRVTDIDEMMHVFTAGAKFIARNVDNNFKQIRHAQQEVRDAFDFLESNTLGVVEAAKAATDRANNVADEVEGLLDRELTHNDLRSRDVGGAHPASAILDASGKDQQEINDEQKQINEDYQLANNTKADKVDVLPATQTKDSFKNAYSTKLTNRFNRIKDQCSVSKSYVWKNPKYNDDTGYRFSLGLNMNGYNTIEWDFVADIDNFWRMRYGFTGSIRPPSITMDATNLSQSPISVGDNSYFRSSDGLNATFDVVFNGVGLLFNHYTDTNGGMFEVRVDGGDPILVSTHSSNPENSIAAASNVSKLIVNGLASVEHTATFKFIGDDPLYPPESGTSRGWFKLSDGVQPEAFTAYVITGGEMGIAATGSRLVSNGILEFAIGAAAVGSDMTPDWVPAHGSASGCIVVNERKIFIDGVQQTGFKNTEVAFNDFTLRQRYTAYNSADTAKQFPMWTGVLYTKFDKQRGLTYSHEFTTLREIYVSDGYTAMTSGRRTSDLSKMTFDNGFVLDISGSTPASQIVHYPGVFKSVSWVGSKTALALSIESIEASAAIGTDFTDGNTSVLTERNDGFCKVYAKPLGTNKTIPAGVTISSTHKIWLATF